MLGEGLEAPGALEWEAEKASMEDLPVTSGAKVEAGVGIRTEATELSEARPRTRSGPCQGAAAW